MSTQQRVVADRLYSILEGMLFIAVNGLDYASRREDNRILFLDIFEELAARTTEPVSGSTEGDRTT